MFRRLFYVHLRQTLPRLRHHLTSGRKLDMPDEDAQILLEGGIARDWSGAREMVEKGKKSASQLFWELSKKRRADWRRRLKNRLLRAFGYYHYDPHARELKELGKRK